MIYIRQENAGDAAAVRFVNEQAFGAPDEANIVDKLRARGKAIVSLVAVEEGKIIGHILFSPVEIICRDKRVEALGLGPMAVLPEYQNRGAGSQMVNAGLAECKKAGHGAVVVLGHPTYYPRFGFLAASRFGIKSEYDAPDEAFMAIELFEEALKDCAGLARYQPEFNEA